MVLKELSTEQLENIADGILVDGIRCKDIEVAKKYFAVSYGINRYLERVDFMKICAEHLRSTGLNDEEMKEHMNYGYEMNEFSMNLVKLVGKVLSKSL